MAINVFALDGNNIALELRDESLADVITVDLVTGAVSSAYIPEKWFPLLEARVKLLFQVIEEDARRSGAVNFLQRLVNISPLDDSQLSLSVSHDGDAYTLSVIIAVGAPPAHVIVNFPHSISGLVAAVGGIVQQSGGGSGINNLSGDVTGSSNANVIAPGVVDNDKFTSDAGGALAQAKVSGLVDALNARALKVVRAIAGAGLAGGGTLGADFTLALATYETATENAGGVSGNSLSIPVISTDQYGRTKVESVATYTVPTYDLAPYLSKTEAASTYLRITDAFTQAAADGRYVAQSDKTVVRFTSAVTAAPGDWASKNYAPVVDNASGTTVLKDVALASTVAALTSGIKYLGAVKTTYATKAAAIAGATAGDRVFVNTSPASTDSGVYDVVAGTPKTLTRSSDFAAGSNASGFYIFDTASGNSYLCNSVSGSDVTGTNVLTFVVYSQAVSYTAGAGLALAGGVFSVDATIARLASPTFTGTPSLPTGTVGVTQTASDSSTKLATTAFVKAQNYLTSADLSTYAPLAAPAFTGNPTATTQLSSDNSTRLATTAFVKNQGYATTASLPAAASADPSDLAQTAAVGASNAYARANHVHSWNGIPYDISGQIGGIPAATEEVFTFVAVRKTKVSSAASGLHRGTRKDGMAAPSSAVAFTVKIFVGGSVTTTGTMTYQTSGAVDFATFTEQTLNPGDKVVVISPANLFGLTGPAFTFAATLAA